MIQGDNDDGAQEGGTLPAGSLSGHAGRHGRPECGRMVRRPGRRAHIDLVEGRLQAARVEGRPVGHAQEQRSRQDAAQGRQGCDWCGWRRLSRLGKRCE